jgi:cytosine/adenosine deaminase-related metal-dependent hydrolase
LNELQQTIIRAKWIAPMTGHGAVRNLAVLIERGIIKSIDAPSNVCASHPDATVIELPESILLPGLINAHTHLEQSDCKCGDSGGASFCDWILSIPSRRSIPGAKLMETAEHATRVGIGQCLKFGVTCVGDISQESQITRPIIAKSPLRCVSFGEVLGLARRRERFGELLPISLNHTHASDRLRVGITPHAPYTVDLPGYRQCLDLARERRLPLATHLSENREEAEFLKNHTGPFQQMWQRLGFWEEPVETFAGSPIEMANAIGLLDYPSLLAHVNYCNDQELAMLARGHASVVYCPRTHEYFGHLPHRWNEMLAEGINVVIGTDSCASSPNLNLLDDLHLIRRLSPRMPAESIWQLVTSRAAKALQWENEIGTIELNKKADLVAFPVESDQPLEELLDAPRDPTGVWIEGTRI